MDDVRLARNLRQEVVRALHGSGFWVDRGSDMAWWEDAVRSHGAYVIPHLYDEMFGDPSEYLAAFSGNGALACAIAWRLSETDNYIADMADGRAWIPEPEASGFLRFSPDVRERIGGKVHVRGGLFTVPVFRQGGLAWALTTIAWTLSLDAGADFVVSQTRKQISEMEIARRVYGYHHDIPMPQHDFPFFDAPETFNLVYSSREDIRDECRRRLAFLRQRYGNDMGTISRAWKRYQSSQELPTRTISINALDEREAQPA